MRPRGDQYALDERGGGALCELCGGGAVHAAAERFVHCLLNLELFAGDPEGRDDSSASDSALDNEAYAAPHLSVTVHAEVSTHTQIHLLPRLVSNLDSWPARRNRTTL